MILIGAAEKTFTINFSKANSKCSLSLHCNGGNSYFFVNEEKSGSLKQIIKMSTFQINFVWEAYLINSTMSRQKKYLEREIYIIFQSIMMLLINLEY